jgi:hypothetical protein
MKRSSKMRKALNASIAIASFVAIALSPFSARADGGGGGQTRRDAGGFAVRAAPGGVPFFHMPVSSAYMEDAGTHDGERRIYMGPFVSTVLYGPDVPPAPPKIAIRKLAPKPGIPWKDGRGWTYFPMTDRNTGQPFVLIEDANGNDVHLNASINVPGVGLAPVR